MRTLTTGTLIGILGFTMYDTGVIALGTFIMGFGVCLMFEDNGRLKP